MAYLNLLEQVQKILVSATCTEKSDSLSNQIFNTNFEKISTEVMKAASSTTQIKQHLLVVPAEDRLAILITVLKMLKKKKTIVFFSSCDSAKFHRSLLLQFGLPIFYSVVSNSLYFCFEIFKIIFCN